MNVRFSMAFMFIMLFYSISLLRAQDIDVFKRSLNDHFNIPQLPDSMKYEEFQILSTDLRLMDAAEAIFVPGLLHFKIKENTMGYTLLATRLLAYAGIIYVDVHNSGIISDVFKWKVSGSNANKIDYYIAFLSVNLAISSYLFDWIHARSLLERKQQKIRFKYAVRR
jgi:hypothetical protein